jgi:hypothetical protein
MNEYFNMPKLKFQKMNLKISIVQSDLIKFKIILNANRKKYLQVGIFQNELQ